MAHTYTMQSLSVSSGVPPQVENKQDFIVVPAQQPNTTLYKKRCSTKRHGNCADLELARALLTAAGHDVLGARPPGRRITGNTVMSQVGLAPVLTAALVTTRALVVASSPDGNTGLGPRLHSIGRGPCIKKQDR